MKRLVLIVLSIGFFFLQVPVFADIDVSRETNKFGIHLAVPDENDIRKAAELVNSNGGKWGYITLVIQENDRDKDKWQNVFDVLRKEQLIPIIRIATQPEGSNWKRATKEDASSWADFLDELNWVVKERYVVLFNEPNHATEWGGAVDPRNFAEVTEAFARKIKEKNEDYIIMTAGLDGAAPSQMPRYEDSGNFIRTMVETIGVEDYNKLFDAWASHSYPNPGFVGSPYGSGKMSVRGYQWELELLSQLGVKELPVFIKETGWDADALGQTAVANNYREVFLNVWLPDPRIRAITPFVLNYQGEPFLKFSWRQFNSEDYYPKYYTVRDLEKSAGNPTLDEKGVLLPEFPSKLVEDSQYEFTVTLQNEGQGYWYSETDYELRFENLPQDRFFVENMPEVPPFSEAEVNMYLKTSDDTGSQSAKLSLYRAGEKVLDGPTIQYEVLAFPQLDFEVTLFPKMSTTGDDFELQIFDENQNIIFQSRDVSVTESKGKISKVRNVEYGKQYRVVILHSYYLPRQAYVTFEEGDAINRVSFEWMWPVDFNADGALGAADVGALFQDPEGFGRLVP